MTIAWFLVPYARRSPATPVKRYVAIDDFTGQIRVDGGSWAETEVFGNHAIVKVNASDATITTLKGLYFYIPVSVLDNTLSTLTTVEKNALHAKINSLGYTDPEILLGLGLGSFAGIGSKTLREVLNFIASKRQTVRYNSATDSFVFDGSIVVPESVASVDSKVQ